MIDKSTPIKMKFQAFGFIDGINCCPQAFEIYDFFLPIKKIMLEMAMAIVGRVGGFIVRSNVYHHLLCR